MDNDKQLNTHARMVSKLLLEMNWNTTTTVQRRQSGAAALHAADHGKIVQKLWNTSIPGIAGEEHWNTGTVLVLPY
jgi:hypothetical protein